MQACAAQCAAQRPLCLGFAFSFATSSCSLRSAVASRSSAPGAAFYFASLPTAFAFSGPAVNSSFLPSDLSFELALDAGGWLGGPDECAAACEVLGCAGFVVTAAANGTGRACWGVAAGAAVASAAGGGTGAALIPGVQGALPLAFSRVYSPPPSPPPVPQPPPSPPPRPPSPPNPPSPPFPPSPPMSPPLARGERAVTNLDELAAAIADKTVTLLTLSGDGFAFVPEDPPPPASQASTAPAVAVAARRSLAGTARQVDVSRLGQEIHIRGSRQVPCFTRGSGRDGAPAAAVTGGCMTVDARGLARLFNARVGRLILSDLVVRLLPSQTEPQSPAVQQPRRACDSSEL